MATYETSILVPRPVEETFAFVSDFRNAAKWDPRTFSVEKVTEGEIGLGTRFMLRGGMVPKHLIPARLRFLDPVLAMPLPYDVVGFSQGKEFVLEGQTPVFRYTDRIQFEAEGTNTRVTYSARLELKGVLALAEPALKLIFQKIGDDATRDIAATVVEGATAGARSPVRRAS